MMLPILLFAAQIAMGNKLDRSVGAPPSTEGAMSSPDFREVARETTPVTAIETLDILQLMQSSPDLSWLTIPPPPARLQMDAAETKAVAGVRSLAQVARRQGLDREPATRAALSALQTVVLAEFAQRALANSIQVSDTDIQAEIAAHPGLYDEYQIRHIFISGKRGRDGVLRSDTLARARADMVYDRLRNKDSFATLAVEFSDDSSSIDAGGLLPAIRGVYLQDSFLPLVAKMSEGDLSAPIRTVEGYHILRLEHRVIATPKLMRSLVVDQLRLQRLPNIIKQAVEALPVAER